MYLESWFIGLALTVGLGSCLGCATGSWLRGGGTIAICVFALYCTHLALKELKRKD